MRPALSRALLSLAILLAGAATARAQFDTASVVGTVRDQSGASIPGAKVTLTSTETSISLTRTTATDGNYEFVTVRPGIYLVTAEMTGFAMALTENVQVQVGGRMRVDMQLAVGQISEQIEVTGASPLIETDSSQRSQVITGDQMREMPLNGREYSALALLSTGVRQSALNKSTTGTPREGAFNVNGLRSTFNNFLIDGVDNNAYGTSNQGFSNQVMQPPPDAVGEFRVVTNNQSAEYGRAAGATVNVAYRSGGNQIHGDAWEFFRDTALNATTYFKPPDGQKPPLRRNQFGAVVGGPIVKNRAFFFADFEGFHQARKATTFSTIPTALQSSGILSVDIRDPRTGVVYPAGTQIPMTAFARQVLGQLPAPNLAGAANNYSILQEFTNDTNKAGGKVDFQFSPRLTAFGRYGWRDLSTNDQPPIPLPSGGGGNGNIYARNKQLVLGSTYVASDRSLLEVRLGWSNTEGGKNPPALGDSNNFGISGLPTDPRIAGGLPTQGINGYTALGRQATNPQWQYPTVWNPKVNYSWLLGKHSLKTGYEYQHIAVEVQDVNPLYGLDSYAGQFSRPVGSPANNNLYNVGDFMLGLRSQYALSTFLIAQMRQDLHFMYAQDDIRLNDRLTLNVGLRYEYATPMWEANNVLTNFDPGTNTMIRATDGSIADRALVDPDRNNFGPRLGFAYTVVPRTVVRGGWGTSYVHINRIGSANLLGINGPQVVRAAVVQGDPTAASFRPTEQGYPTGLTDSSNFNPSTALVSYIPRDFQSSPVHSWYLSARVRAENAPRRRVRRQQGVRSADGRQLQPGGAQQFGRLDSARHTPSDSDARRHHVRVQRRQVRLQSAAGEVRVAPRVGGLAPEFADALEGARQLRRSAREPERQLSGSTGPSQPRRGLWGVGVRPALQQHDELHLGTAVRQGEALGIRPLSGDGRTRRRLAGRGGQHRDAWRNGDVHLLAQRRLPGVGDYERLLGRQQLPPQRDLRSVPLRRSAVDHQLVQRGLRDLAHRCQPAVRQRGAQHRTRPQLLDVRLCRDQGVPHYGHGAGAVQNRGVQSVQPRELHVAGRQPEQQHVWHDHIDLRRAAAAARPQVHLVGTGFADHLARFSRRAHARWRAPRA